jgi:transposase
MKNLSVLGIDLAKNVFQIHGVNPEGKVVLKKKLQRDQLIPFLRNLPACLIGIEACAGAHYWGHQFNALGHTTKLMSPVYVKAYVMSHKSDAKDAEACAEAVTRPKMRFVPLKSAIQLEMQSLHRIRSHHVKAKTALMNMIRGLLSEVGIVIPRGMAFLRRRLQALIDSDNVELSGFSKSLFISLAEQLDNLDHQVVQLSYQIEVLATEDDACKRLMSIPGLGYLTASALTAMIGNGSEFKNGRGLSAYVGIIPKQHSSGGTEKLVGITKRGDRYLRQLLIHGGRSAILSALKLVKDKPEFKKNDDHSCWIRQLVDRVGKNKAAVAVANKNARIAIRLLKTHTTFDAKAAHVSKKAKGSTLSPLSQSSGC